MNMLFAFYTAGGALAHLLAIPTPLAALAYTVPPIWQRPDDFAFRTGLTALALLLAIAAGPRLSHLVGTMPTRMEGAFGRDGRDGRAGRNGRPGRNGRQPEADVTAAPLTPGQRATSGWLGWVTLTSIWVAVAAAVATIWLWGQPGFQPGDPSVYFRGAGYILTRLAISLVVLAVTLVLGRLLQRGASASLRRGRVNENLVLLLGRTIYVSTMLVSAVVILGVWDTGVVVPIALLGALGIALSLALQDVLKNLVSGVYLLIERPFVIGDQISMAPFTGIVEDIQLRVTWVLTPDGQRVLIPNALLFSSPVVNLSALERRRVALAVRLPRREPDAVEAAEADLLAVLESVPGVRSEPPPEITLSGATAESIVLRAAFWVPARDPAGTVISEAIEQLRARLPEAEIGLAATPANA